MGKQDDDDDGVTADFQLPPDDGGPDPDNADPDNQDQPNEPDPNQPATRRIVINGVATEVTEEVAQQIEAERQAAEAERQRLQQEKEQMAASRASDNPADPVDTPDDFDDQFWTNPRQAVQSLLAEERQKIEQDLEEKYRKTEAQKEFWSDFYGKYPELKGDSDIVEMILNKNYSELSQMEVGPAMDELAKRAAHRIGKQLKDRGGSGRSGNDRTDTEPAAAPAGKQPKSSEGDDDAPAGTTLSAVLKQRRQKRQQAG